MSAVARVRIGYTAGVFDLLHRGHLTLLGAARERSDFLIVGVSTDELAERLHHAPPVMPFVERVCLVQHLRCVDLVVPQTSDDKVAAWRSLRFDRVFAGDDLAGSARWTEVERALAGVGVGVEYLPATYVRPGRPLRRGPSDLVDG